MKYPVKVIAIIALAGCSESSDLENLRRENQELKLRVELLERQNGTLIANGQESEFKSTPPESDIEKLEREADEAARRANAQFNRDIADTVSGKKPPPEGY